MKQSFKDTSSRCYPSLRFKHLFALRETQPRVGVDLADCKAEIRCSELSLEVPMSCDRLEGDRDRGRRFFTELHDAVDTMARDVGRGSFWQTLTFRGLTAVQGRIQGTHAALRMAVLAGSYSVWSAAFSRMDGCFRTRWSVLGMAPLIPFSTRLVLVDVCPTNCMTCFWQTGSLPATAPGATPPKTGQDLAWVTLCWGTSCWATGGTAATATWKARRTSPSASAFQGL